MKKYVWGLLLLLLMFSCKLERNPISHNVQQPKLDDILIEVEKLKSSLPQPNSSLSTYAESIDKTADNTILKDILDSKQETYIHSRLLAPKVNFKDSLAYYYKKNWDEWNSYTAPLSFFTLKYDDKINSNLRGKTTLFVTAYPHGAGTAVEGFFPEEKLQDFHSDQVYLQVTLKEKTFRLPLVEGKDITSNNGFSYWGEFVKEDDISFLTNLIQSAKEILDTDPTQPAFMQYVWKGTNAQGQPEIVYSGSYKFDDKEMVQANYNLLTIFNKLNGLSN